MDCETCRQNELQGNSTAGKIKISLPALSCFQKSISQPITRRHRVCRKGVPPVQKSRLGPCPSDDYVAKTAQVFYDVTQCLGIQESEYFFALINRESRFQITAQSATGASCYGQLTGIAIADINQRFLPYNSNDENCAEVFSHFQPLPVKKKGRRYTKTSTARCRAYSNPYSCLFYSALYYKKALERAERLVRDMDMILVRVKGQRRPWVFKDQDQYDEYFKTQDKGQIVSEQRLSLLQNKQLAAHVIAMTAYNGGPSVERGFRHYINQIKSRMWHPLHQRNIISMIFSKTPWGIPQGDFVDSFTRSLKAQKAYRSETVGYTKDVFSDYEKISQGIAPACGVLPAKKALTPEGQYSI